MNTFIDKQLITNVYNRSESTLKLKQCHYHWLETVKLYSTTTTRTITTLTHVRIILTKGNLLFIIGGVGVGCCLYSTNQSKLTLLCKDNNINNNNADDDDENIPTNFKESISTIHSKESNNKDSSRITNNKSLSIWSVLVHFVKSDSVWFLVSIPVGCFIIIIIIINNFSNFCF